jgi:hypothetical protein
LDFSGLEYPLKVSDIPKFERRNYEVVRYLTRVRGTSVLVDTLLGTADTCQLYSLVLRSSSSVRVMYY